MGMMIEGSWCEVDEMHQAGEYVRNVSKCHIDIEPKRFFLEPQRFYLLASWSCPWSHRTMILRHLSGLSEYIGLHLTGGEKVQGYPANHGESWQIPGTQGSSGSIKHLHQLYSLSDPSYSGRCTVPLLWDSQQLKIVSNESTTIMSWLQQGCLEGSSLASYLPFSAQQQQCADALSRDIYQGLNNGVYRAGFAQSQAAHERAVCDVFSMLEMLELRLSRQAFLMETGLSTLDWQLFVTLVRFDVEYYFHYGCRYKKLCDYPHLWRYARVLYNMDGIAQTVDFEAIHRSHYHRAPYVIARLEQDWSLA